MNKRTYASRRKSMSFEQWVQKYQPLLYRVMKTLHIYRDQEEYYQIGLIALWEAKESFQPEKGPFLPYAYTIVRGRMLDFLKKEKKRECEKPTPIEKMTFGSYEMTVDDSFEEYMKLLTPKQQKWLFYTYQCDYSQKQIAEIEKTTVEAVKSWRKQAIKKLRRLKS